MGAPWCRLMTSKEPDYGFVDDQTPEVALAVVPDHRGYGMGGALLRELQDAARAQGYSALSVEKGNLALELCERNGFVKLLDRGCADDGSGSLCRLGVSRSRTCKPRRLPEGR